MAPTLSEEEEEEDDDDEAALSDASSSDIDMDQLTEMAEEPVAPEQAAVSGLSAADDADTRLHMRQSL